mmetsp:Transcript_6028/g.8869  ORF Transcript_6028/g.8869 Transcript_6028/m.8869 type:complete len:1137 (+) Transcript_6028:217-3627(+)
MNSARANNHNDRGNTPINIELPSYSSSDALQKNAKTNYSTNRLDNKVSSDRKGWKFEIPSQQIVISYPEEKVTASPPSPEIRSSDEQNFAWRFSSTETDWSLSSQSLLSLTFAPAAQSVPEATRKSIPADYAQRLVKRSKCMKACIRGKKKIYMETYNGSDIQEVKMFNVSSTHGEKIMIRGFHGPCQAVQILFRSKVGNRMRFDYNCKDDNQRGDTRGSHKYDNHDASKGDKSIPCEARQVLIEKGYIPDVEEIDDDGLPLPPWRKTKDNSQSNLFFGPVVTFVIPDVSECQTEESIDTTGTDGKDTSPPPLLWKVQLPPDPSISLEAMTVLDGALDVHPPEKCRSDDDDRASKSNVNNSNGNERRDYRIRRDGDCNAAHPTNIFLNGYQSWSFTGSVNQGDEQPKSAMPDFLSKAFNLGAESPPSPSETRGCGLWDSFGIGSFHDVAYYKSDFFACASSNKRERFGNDELEGSRLDEFGGPALVLGFISQRKQFGLVNFDSDLYRVSMHASAQGLIASRTCGISSDWAYCQLLSDNCYDEEPMVHYLNAVSSYNEAMPVISPLTGWCSWYHYYENIDFQSLCNNFEKLAELKPKIASDAVIIDDGYMTSWGDWDSLKPRGFPRNSGGMKALAENIESHGMIPGVWMAPFACDKNSKLAKEHPDWIIHNDEGRIANSSNCGKFFYALDATNPSVLRYVFDCIQMAVNDWGYKVLKLDFLYAACLQGNGKYDITMSRAEAMHLALQTLRAAAGPDTFIIGCGCPVGPAIGYVNANRISADTGPTWYPDFPLPWWDNQTLPSLRAMVRNSITRSCMGHRFWHNDPDCILLGDTTRLTDVEVISAATVIGMTGGMLLLSDDLSKLSNERLRIGTRIHPITGVTATPLDLHSTSETGIPSLMRLWCTDSMHNDSLKIPLNNSYASDKKWQNPWGRKRNCLPVVKGLGSWSMVSLSNWLDTSSVVTVPISSLSPPRDFSEKEEEGPELGYHIFSFWSSKYIWVSADLFKKEKNLTKNLGPHASEIFHVKAVSPDRPQYIGSELHFTCGYEVLKFEATSTSIDIQLMNSSKRSGFVYLYVPSYTDAMDVKMSGMIVQGEIVSRCPKVAYKSSFYGGQVVRVWVVIHGNGSPNDGRISIKIN